MFILTSERELYNLDKIMCIKWFNTKWSPCYDEREYKIIAKIEHEQYIDFETFNGNEIELGEDAYDFLLASIDEGVDYQVIDLGRYVNELRSKCKATS